MSINSLLSANPASINFTRNRLQQLPTEIGLCANLGLLNLSNNLLQQLPTEVGQCANLWFLNLSDNQLQQLPTEVGQCANLQSLYLSGNQLQQLSTEVGLCANLEFLNLNGNQLQQLPTEMGQCANLQGLYLSGNQLQQLSTEVGLCANLEFLGLSGNQLQQLPTEVGLCANLKFLYLSNNPNLRGLPLEVFQLSTECIIDITGCPFSTQVLERMREQMQALEYSGPSISHSVLEQRPYDPRSSEELITELYEISGKPPLTLNVLLQDANLQVNLQSWLSRLSWTCDYKNNGDKKIGFARKVIQYLECANEHAKFREAFATIIEGSTETCGDRVSLSVLHVGVAYHLATIDHRDMQLLEKFLTRGVWVLSLLEKIARDKVVTLPFFDEIEVYLGYPIKLRERFGEEFKLLIDVEDMLYFACSAITLRDLDEAEAAVNLKLNNEEEKLQFLIEQDIWKEALKENFPESCLNLEDMRFQMIETHGWEEINDAYNNGLIALTKMALNSTCDQSISLTSSLTEQQSSFTHFYQALSQGNAPIHLFEMIGQEDKDLIFECVWINAGKPQTEDFRWGEHHALEDLSRLRKSLEDVILIKFERLGIEQRNVVYGMVYELADQPTTEDSQWGEHHARDDLGRLAEALSKL